MKIDWTQYEVFHRNANELDCRRTNLQLVPRQPEMEDDRALRVYTNGNIFMDRVIVENIFAEGNQDAIDALFAAEVQAGMSLIELLLVVSVILILSAISIPSLMRSRAAADESSAVGSLRTLNTSCVNFITTYGVYPSQLSDLGPTSGQPTSTSADLIDGVLAAGTKSGYSFVYTAGTGQLSYSITAAPTSTATGQRTFFTDQSGVIRSNSSGAADATSTPIG
jgi:type IV pilus assembly protein PilA